MRIIQLLIIFTVFVSSSNYSNYPLKFKFDDSRFIINAILVNKSKEKSVLSINFVDNNDNFINIENNFISYPKCQIKTLEDLESLSDVCKKYHNLAGTKYKILKNNNFTFVIFKDTFFTIHIFLNNIYINTIVSNLTFKDIEVILNSIAVNKQKPQTIDFYINCFTKNLELGYYNKAFKCLASAYILKPKNDKLNKLYTELIKAKITFLKNIKNNVYLFK